MQMLDAYPMAKDGTFQHIDSRLNVSFHSVNNVQGELYSSLCTENTLMDNDYVSLGDYIEQTINTK